MARGISQRQRIFNQSGFNPQRNYFIFIASSSSASVACCRSLSRSLAKSGRGKPKFHQPGPESPQGFRMAGKR